MRDTADVVIVGGGVIGSSAAWHLRQDGHAGRILVVERDPTYARASAFLAMGGIRQQFCTAVTVRMVQFSVAFWKTFDDRMRVAGHTPHAWFRQRGYLFLADEAAAQRLLDRHEAQRRAGAHVRMLSRDELRLLVPDVALDDIVFGVFGPDDGYANPREVLAGFRHAAAAAGAEYVADEVAAITHAHGRVSGVRLASGRDVSAPVVVNAAGAWAGRVAALAGVPVPVEPQRQMLFRAALPIHWPYRFPMIVDPGGVHWRHDDPVGAGDRDGIIVAFTKWDEPPGENFDADDTRWARDVHPALVRRLPALAHLGEVAAWAGLYEMTPDHNPVIGEHPALAGLVMACGFSGHGVMMSPATGKIVSELVRLGRSESFDVGLFAPDRFERGALVHDAATI
jgi:FAD-dependent oxidoreductase domain-containing protein 1